MKVRIASVLYPAVLMCLFTSFLPVVVHLRVLLPL